MPRVYETTCKECGANAVLNGYCRQCGFNTHTEEVTSATQSSSDDSPEEWDGYDEPTDLDPGPDSTD